MGCALFLIGIILVFLYVVASGHVDPSEIEDTFTRTFGEDEEEKRVIGEDLFD